MQILWTGRFGIITFMLPDNVIENSTRVVPEGPEHHLGFTTIVSQGEKEII